MHVSPYIYRGPTNLRIWEEKDPKTQDLIAIKHYTQHLRADADDLDGRPSASRARTRRTPGWDSRPAATTATCSSSRRRT